MSLNRFRDVSSTRLVAVVLGAIAFTACSEHRTDQQAGVPIAPAPVQSTSPSPKPSVGSVAAPVLIFEAMTDAELDAMWKQTVDAIDRSGEKRKAAATRIEQLKPNLKSSDRAVVVKTAREILALMEERLAELDKEELAVDHKIGLLKASESKAKTSKDKEYFRSEVKSWQEANASGQKDRAEEASGVKDARMAFGDMLDASARIDATRSTSTPVPLELLYGKEGAEVAKRIWDRVSEEERRKAQIYQDELIRERARRSF